jgi:hypothetical protein
MSRELVFDEKKYLEKLWKCYQEGIRKGFSKKMLFIELVSDLIKQTKIPRSRQKPSTVQEIIEEYLKQNGFDGLYSSSGCDCKLKDLMPCEEGMADCLSGYKISCNCGNHDFRIGP